MRWLALILIYAVIARVTSEPDPKKYKPDDVEKDKKLGTTLTVDEKKFLREVEEKFGIKSDVPAESEENAPEIKVMSTNTTEKGPLPVVIAIEIVNDTDSKSKGKRTIDANLGYGYQTNDGYSYTYFGKPIQEKGKFMIYPYSQHNTPSQHSAHSGIHGVDGYSQQTSEKHSQATSVEIQPSQAFELVSVKENEQYDDTKKSYESSHTYTKDTATIHPSTLYTTYNGEGLSGLSGQFPSLMSNYFVEPKKLLTNPQYQDIGLTQDHLSTNGLDQNRPVVPVLVLRIPSSYLMNPTDELYPNLPNNYPLSHYLNNVNLQDLVNQYLKKNGYNFVPHIMAYQSPQLSTSDITPTVSSSYSSEPQQYSNPHVQPSYTQSDNSGVQYSAVKPVMAKYPSSLTRQKYLSSQLQSHYSKPIQQQKYEYQYQHVPQPMVDTQAYYGQSLYQNSQQTPVVSYEQQSEYAALAKPITNVVSDTEHASPQYSTNHDTKIISVQYDTNTPTQSSQALENSNNDAPQYDYSKESQVVYSPHQALALTQDYSSQSVSDYTSSQHTNDYYAQKQPVQTETINAYPSLPTYAEQSQQSYPDASATQGYDYPKQREESVSNSYIISGNYPSKDHTIATVLPFSYKRAKKPNTATIQTVSYVTPEPYSSKYQSRYKIMVPQTVLKNHDEKVMYVNSMPMHYTKAGYYNQGYNAEEEYSAGKHYTLPISKQKSHSYPRHYHSYPKRMVRLDSKGERSLTSSLSKKQSDKKKSS